MIDSLRVSRQRYVKHLREHMRAPDGSYEEDFNLPDLPIPERSPKVRENLETNNPLSLHKEVCCLNLPLACVHRFRTLGKNGLQLSSYGGPLPKMSSVRE